jgi:thioesterase domain-containing protein
MQEMKRVQPKGPYIIAGYSAGVSIAYEMISQLNLMHGDEVKICLILKVFDFQCFWVV